MTKKAMINEMVEKNYFITTTGTKESLKNYLNRIFLKEEIEQRYKEYLKWKEEK